MEHIAEIHGLSYAYRGHEDELVLQDINLEIRRGEFLTLAGRTGSGKSTLCYAINGFVPHSFGGRMEGEVRVCGLNTGQATIPALARKVGMVLQSADHNWLG
jgi:energy-coupling factor transporter ATP-binding protein EcfA2